MRTLAAAAITSVAVSIGAFGYPSAAAAAPRVQVAAAPRVHLVAHVVTTRTGSGDHAATTKRSVVTGLTGLRPAVARKIIADIDARTAAFVVVPRQAGPWELVDTVSLVHADQRYVTLAQNTYYYAGGANGQEAIIPTTYSARTGSLLTLKSFAAKGKLPALLKVLSVRSRKALAAQGITPDFYNPGTTPTYSNFQYVEPLPAGLRIEFPQEDVATHAQGTVEVLVPWSALKGLIGLPLPTA